MGEQEVDDGILPHTVIAGFYGTYRKWLHGDQWNLQFNDTDRLTVYLKQIDLLN